MRRRSHVTGCKRGQEIRGASRIVTYIEGNKHEQWLLTSPGYLSCPTSRHPVLPGLALADYAIAGLDVRMALRLVLLLPSSSFHTQGGGHVDDHRPRAPHPGMFLPPWDRPRYGSMPSSFSICRDSPELVLRSSTPLTIYYYPGYRMIRGFRLCTPRTCQAAVLFS